MSAANAWCKTQLTTTAKTDNSTTEKPAAAATDSIDATAAHGRGHVKHASDANQ